MTNGSAVDPAVAIGARLAAILAERGIPQARIGEVLNIAQSQVSRRLSGEIPLNVAELADLAEYLGMPLADLLPTD